MMKMYHFNFINMKNFLQTNVKGGLINIGGLNQFNQCIKLGGLLGWFNALYI